MRLRALTMTPYTVTPDDALWLARAVEAEGPVQEQVAAVLLNGFCFARSRGYTKSLATFVRAYAQPVNPRWYLTGDLFLASLEKLSEVQRDDARKVAEKRERVHSQRASFTPGTQAAVRDALNGRVEIAPVATDYAAAWVDASAKGYKPVTHPSPGRNRLWTRPGAERWTGYLTDATDAWPWLLTVAALGFAAWRHWGAA